MLNVQEFQASTWSAVPSVRVSHSTNQAITTATTTALALNTDVFDRWDLHDTVTNNSRLTVSVPGVYLVGGSAKFADASTVGSRSLFIRKNGSSIIGYQRVLPDTVAGTAAFATTSALIDMNLNDYVELMVEQDSGGNLNVEAVANYSPIFWAVWQAR